MRLWEGKLEPWLGDMGKYPEYCSGHFDHWVSQVVKHNSLWAKKVATRGTVSPKVTVEGNTKAGLSPSSSWLSSGWAMAELCQPFLDAGPSP